MKILALFLGLCAVCRLGAEPYEIVVANIASRGFDVFLRTPEPALESRIDLFRDAAGTVPETGVTIERQALFTGATSGDDYARRCADRLMRTAMTQSGNTLFRVADASPDTAYFARVTCDGVVWPTEGLQEIRTLPSGEWQSTSHQMLVNVNRSGDGWAGTLTVPGALAPLLAVCGDGAPTNTSFFFNFADLADAAGAPFVPPEGAAMTFRLYGKTGTPVTQRELMYAPPSSSEAAVAVLSTEMAPLLRLMIASAVQAVSEPAPGENFFFDGSAVTCRITQASVTQLTTQLVAYGWSGTGNVPASGRKTSFTFSLTTDSELFWNWRTNFWLDVVANHGTVDLSTGWYRAGVALTASADPNAEWLFAGWTGLASGPDPVASFTASAPGQLVAAFEPMLAPGGGGMPEWWLTQAGLTGADRNVHADPDNDGMSNLKEWQADTSPTNSLSDLRITAINRTGGDVNLTWRGGREAKQVVEILEGDLTKNLWRPISTNLPPTTIIGSCKVELEGKPAVFFRIKAER